METKPILDAAAKGGVLSSAMSDTLARAEVHFGAKALTPESAAAFVAQLRSEAPHLFTPVTSGLGETPETIPSWLSPSERASRYRQLHPQPPVSRRPQRYDPTPEQLKSLEGKSTTERLTAYRAWQAAAQGKMP